MRARAFGPALTALILCLCLLFARNNVDTPKNLDLREQSRDPGTPIPGAGTEPVVKSVDADGFITLKHVAGVSKIPARAQRIVALGWTEELLGLGIKPVGAIADGRRGFPEHLLDKLTDVLPIDINAGSPDMESISKCKPDLIVCTWWHMKSWKTLESIAPTIILQPAHWEWRLRLKDLAVACGREAEGELAIQNCDQHLSNARETIAAHISGKSVALLRIYAREFRLYGYGYSGPLLYGDLALPKPELIDRLAWNKDMIRLSLEGLGQLKSDIILLMVEEGLPVSYQVQERLEHHPLWNALEAVKNKRVIAVPNRVMRGGYLSRMEMAQLLSEKLIF